jgi:hypothetical protein
MKKYSVKTRFTFTGTFFINAGSKEEARKLVENDCGLVIGGGIHTACHSQDEVDWEFPFHPEKQIVNIRRKKHGQRKKLCCQ